MDKKIVIAAATVAVISTVIIASIVTYYLSLPSDLPTTKVPKRLEIISDIGYIEKVKDVTFFVVAGVVRNNLTTNVESANITAIFFDTKNNTIETGYTPVLLDIIKPEQKAPFAVYIVLNWSAPVPERYELTASCFETNNEPITGLEILEPLNKSVDAEGYYRISGEIQNNGGRKAIGVRIICTYYNSDGSLITISNTYVSPEINAGSKAVFETSSRPYKIDHADYELFIAVHSYEPLRITNYVLLTVLIAAFLIFIYYMKRRGW